MPETLQLFPIKVYKDFYASYNDLKKNLFPKLEDVFEKSRENNNPFMKEGAVCSYQANSYLHIDFPEETKHVINFVESAARKFWKECGYYEELDPYVFQTWANITTGGGWVQSHLHGNMPFTAVLYIDASPEQGNLILDHPLDTVMMSQPIGPDVKYPIEHEIEVNSGDFIMFPAFLKHKVRPNMTDRPRLIMAFNIGCKGKYWSSHWTQK
jgi:uncharacterized protein (TIGR02466 family)